MLFLVAHWKLLAEAWVAVTAILVVLVVYRGSLSINEDDELYLNKAENVMMAAEQRVIIQKMNHLRPAILLFAFLSGLLALTGYALWVWSIW
jgi:hypothetical protein